MRRRATAGRRCSGRAETTSARFRTVAVLDALEQVVPDQVAGGGFEPEPGAQPRRLDVGAVAGLLHPGARRVVRPTPAVFVVEGVAQRIERLPPSRRGDVEADHLRPESRQEIV